MNDFLFDIFRLTDDTPVSDSLTYWVHLDTGVSMKELSSIPEATLAELYPEVSKYGPNVDITKRFIHAMSRSIIVAGSSGQSLESAVVELLTYGAKTSWTYCAELKLNQPARMKLLQKNLNSLPDKLISQGYDPSESGSAGRVIVNLTCPDIYPDKSIQEEGLLRLCKVEAELKVAERAHHTKIRNQTVARAKAAQENAAKRSTIISVAALKRKNV